MIPSIRINKAPRMYDCERDWRWQPSPLEDYDFWMVFEGSGRMVLDGKTYRLVPGVSFLLPPGARLLATHDPQRPLRVFAVHFDPLDEHGNPVCWPFDFRQGRVIRDLSLFWTLARLCESAVHQEHEWGEAQSRLALQQMLMQWRLEGAVSLSKPVDLRLQGLLEEIRREPAQSWGVEVMASRVSLSRAQLTRRFRKAAGMAPTRYVIQTRLQRAQELILESDLSLGQVADALGYRDIYFFSRQFKQFMGHSPGVLRRDARNSFTRNRP